MELYIERMGSQGDGLTADGLAVGMALAGEQVRVRRYTEKGRAHTELTEVISPSPERIAPVCPHFSACGGCALQHWDMAAYSAWKRDQVIAALKWAGLETEVAPIWTTPTRSRRRVGLHARKSGKQVQLGFKARRSWSLVPIEVCEVTDPRIIAALPALKELSQGLFSDPKSAPILHVTTSLSGLDIDITGVERNRSGGLSGDARMQIAMIAGEADFARVTLAGEILYQSRLPTVRFGRATVGLPTGSFLQATPQAEAEMVRLVMTGLGDARKVADLFCGAGTFTFPMAEKATVLAADGASGAITALKAAIAPTPGLKGINAEVRDLFRRPVSAAELKGLDAIVFDPPRAGAEAQAREIAMSDARRVMGISCNPATFTRDAKILCDAGFSLDSVVPVDQFLWSSHVELVATFTR